MSSVNERLDLVSNYMWVMGNCCGVLKVDYMVYVCIGDLKGVGINVNVKICLYDSEGNVM